jgi:hypothetical protein
MSSYDKTRQHYRPEHIKVLLVAESPPPSAAVQSSRHFYRSEKLRTDDRLFINTIRALYPEAADMSELQLEQDKEQWLRKFQSKGWYMIEALDKSLAHPITKAERQELIRENLPHLIEHIKELIAPDTKIILIKSNVFIVASEPLQAAGFHLLNKELLDYPGHFNQRAYREKLAKLAQM